MKIKKKVICSAIGGMIAVWILLGLFARRGALYLMGDDRSLLSRSDDDVPCFGIRFYSKSQGNSIRWLNESECKYHCSRVLRSFIRRPRTTYILAKIVLNCVMNVLKV